jgi:hypothetical protein
LIIWCRLIAAGHQDDAIERISAQNFNKPEIGQIAIESCSRPSATFLEGVNGKFEGYATRVANTFLDARGKAHVNSIARSKIASGLRDSDHGPASLKLLA